MELRHLRYFVAVAEELHFTRAAERLGIEQPPLSQQIQNLEREIGTPLFRRLPRGVAMTDAGVNFLADARSILAHVERASEHARRIARGEMGRIRVGMINSAPFHPFIPRVIREFRSQHPEAALSIDENFTPELAAAVVKEVLDIAFIRPLIRDEPALNVEHLFDEDMVVALPNEHPLTRYRSLPLRALALEPFVMFPRPVGSGLYDEIISACQRAGFSPQIMQEASQVTSIVNLVAADLGISLVPASMRQVHSEGVVYRPMTGDAPRARMSLAHRRGDDSPTVQNFLALVRSMVKKQRGSRRTAG